MYNTEINNHQGKLCKVLLTVFFVQAIFISNITQQWASNCKANYLCVCVCVWLAYF